MNMNKPRIFTKSFVFLFLCNFFVFFVFYAMLTTLPIYVLDELHGSASQAGLMVTIFLLSAIVIRPFSGTILERFHKKTVLIISLSFFLFSTILYVWVKDFTLLLALRFFHGVWFSIATTATSSLVAEIIPIARRGEGIGYFAMSMNIAVVAGPFLALTVIQQGTFSLLFMLLAGFATVALFVSLFVNIKMMENNQGMKRLALSDLIERRSFLPSLIGALVAFAYSSIIAFISVFTKSIGLLEAASYFFLVFSVAMLLTRPFAGRWFDLKGPQYVIIPSLLMFFLGLFVLSFTTSFSMLMLSAVFIGMGYGNLLPCFQSLAIQATDKHRISHATATFYTLFDIGVASGSFVLGIIVAFVGYKSLYLSLSAYLILVVGIYWLYQVKNQKKKVLSERTII